MGGLQLKTTETHQIKGTILRRTYPEENKKSHQGASKVNDQRSTIKALVSSRWDKMEMNDMLSIDKNGTETVHVTSDITEVG